MKKTGLWGALLAVLLLYGFVDDAAAQQRSSFYKMAKRTSSALVSSSWKRLHKDCHNVDKLVQSIDDGVDRITRDLRNRRFRGKSASDFGHGYIEGLVTTLDSIISQCSNKCSTIGQASGEWSAKIFCAVSEVVGESAKFDGLIDKPTFLVTSLGETYSRSCEVTFVRKAKSICPLYARGRNFKTYYPANIVGCCSWYHLLIL